MKKIIYLTIIIILFLTSLFLFLQNKMLKKEVLVLNERIAVLEKEINEVKNKPPLGWKEYIDDKYKFRVWYPEEITDNVYGTTHIILGGGNSDDVIFYLSAYDIPQPQMLHIYIYKTNLDIKEAIKNDFRKDRSYRLGVDKRYSDAEIISGIQQIKFGGLDFYRFGDNGDYYLKKDDLLFAFIPGGSGPADYKQMYETMVQSLRFIEQP